MCMHVCRLSLISCQKVKLPVESQQEILAELVSIPHLKETLDTLETVIAFLTTEGGVHVEMKLSSYAESLKIQFSSKVWYFEV